MFHTNLQIVDVFTQTVTHGFPSKPTALGYDKDLGLLAGKEIPELNYKITQQSFSAVLI